ncbi:adenylate cyclase type 10-like [Morphnus guianensis]
MRSPGLPRARPHCETTCPCPCNWNWNWNWNCNWNSAVICYRLHDQNCFFVMARGLDRCHVPVSLGGLQGNKEVAACTQVIVISVSRQIMEQVDPGYLQQLKLTLKEFQGWMLFQLSPLLLRRVMVVMRTKSGFTALTEKFIQRSGPDRGTDELAQTLNDYLCDILEEMLIFGGDIFKFAGDAVLVLWKGEINKIVLFDKGCAFLCVFGLGGETVFCGVTGHPLRHEYTVIGQKVNLAARMMVHYPELVSCDAATYASSRFEGTMGSGKSHLLTELAYLGQAAFCAIRTLMARALGLQDCEQCGARQRTLQTALRGTIEESSFCLLNDIFLEFGIFVIDNAHFIDPASWSIMSPVLRNVSYFMVMSLAPGYARTEGFCKAAADNTIQRSSGIPYYCKELLGCLLCNDMLLLHSRRRAEKLAQLDRIKPLKQTVLKFAAVIGPVFTTQLLSHILPDGMRHKMNCLLDMLVSDNILKWLKTTEVPEGVLVFCVPLLREAAYELWPERQRVALHRKCAAFLERHAHKCKSCGQGDFVAFHCECKAIVESVLVPLARHYVAMGDAARAFYYLLESAAAYLHVSNMKLNEAEVLRNSLEKKANVIARFEEATFFSLKCLSLLEHLFSLEGTSSGQTFCLLAARMKANTDRAVDSYQAADSCHR